MSLRSTCVTLAGGLLGLAAVVALPALADDGSAAPGLGKNCDWINAPVQDQLEELKGRVVFIDLWGIN